MTDSREIAVLSMLMVNSVIPKLGTFNVEESMLREYLLAYHKLFGSTGSALSSKSNTKFARRLAGRTLVHLNAERGASYRTIKAGLLYLIENPIFPEYLKVGITVDINKRLSQYQTGDPHRAYKIHKYEFVLDKSFAEKQILSNKNQEDGLGEWMLKAKAIQLFKQVV